MFQVNLGAGLYLVVQTFSSARICVKLRDGRMTLVMEAFGDAGGASCWESPAFVFLSERTHGR